MTASPFFESRLPVGSSAKRIDGLPPTCPGHRHALLLAARQLRWVMIHPMRHADFFQSLLRVLFSLRPAQPAIGQGEFNVFINGEVADEIKALEDEADVAVANARPLGEIEVRHRVAVEGVASVGG